MQAKRYQDVVYYYKLVRKRETKTMINDCKQEKNTSTHFNSFSVELCSMRSIEIANIFFLRLFRHFTVETNALNGVDFHMVFLNENFSWHRSLKSNVKCFEAFGFN